MSVSLSCPTPPVSLRPSKGEHRVPFTQLHVESVLGFTMFCLWVELRSIESSSLIRTECMDRLVSVRPERHHSNEVPRPN